MNAIDVSGMDGTRCYCDAVSATKIRGMLAETPLSGIHFLGSGDYHYLTLFQLERIREPFCLILFDNHSDRQEGAFGNELLSCGNWVISALKLPMLKDMAYIPDAGWNRYPTHSLPIYVSIDLDVLSTEFAETNWNQGTMNTNELCSILRRLIADRRVIGTDICGAREDNTPGPLDLQAISQISKTMIL